MFTNPSTLRGSSVIGWYWYVFAGLVNPEFGPLNGKHPVPSEKHGVVPCWLFVTLETRIPTVYFFPKSFAIVAFTNQYPMPLLSGLNTGVVSVMLVQSAG